MLVSLSLQVAAGAGNTLPQPSLALESDPPGFPRAPQAALLPCSLQT